MKKIKYIITLLLFLLVCVNSYGQDRYFQLKQQLDLLVAESPGLEEKVDFSVGRMSLKEFLLALGKSNKVNISVDPAVQGEVINTLNNVTVSELLIFFAKQHQLDFDITGNIIHVKPYIQEVVKEVIPVKTIPFEYDTASNLLTLELKNDSLPKVTKLLTQKTSKNVVFQPGLENKKLSVYLEKVDFDQAMDKIAFSNNLKISKTADGFYLIEGLEKNQNGKNNKRFNDLNSNTTQSVFKVDSLGINLEVENQPLSLIVKNLFQTIGRDYFLYTALEGNVTLKVSNLPLEELLQKLFYGTKYTYRIQDDILIIGERELEGLREARRIYLQHRSVEKIIEFIPDNIKKGVSIKEFTELNSLLVSGSLPQIIELEQFIRSIDQPVPVVIIEVMIVDYQRNNDLSTGIEAGVGTEPATSGGKVYPTFEYNLNATSLNKLIQSFNGFGALNLGPVTPNFYLNLRLLETNGVLNVKSTPKLSTLNGHEASISIGNTEFYLIQTSNIQGGVNPINQITQQYQSVKADFSLTIKPIVSGDDNVTLEIQVEQSDFTARISPSAPPGSVNRTFNSIIRVKNEEMILLGGLEEKSVDDSGSGVPLLSRIPILKYLFSSRTTKVGKSKLNIFIKPTVIN